MYSLFSFSLLLFTLSKSINFINENIVFVQISDSGKSASISTHTTKATYVSLTIIKAELPTTSRSKRSYPLYGRGFDISLSYDGINFGDIMPLVIFNDKCYNCSAITLECNKTVIYIILFQNIQLKTKWNFVLQVLFLCTYDCAYSC